MILSGWKIEEKCHVNQFYGIIHFKTLGCRKIKSIFRDIKWCFNPFSPHDASKHHFTSMKADLISPQLRGFRRKISMKLFHQHMAKLTIFFNLSPYWSHLHPLKVKNYASNVVDEDDHGKFRPERVNASWGLRGLRPNTFAKFNANKMD